MRSIMMLIPFFLIVALGSETSPEKTTVVEGNHFYSNYELNTTYNIAQVNVDRPIIYILRKKEDGQIFDNNITINLISGDKSVQCKFISFNGMCFLQHLSNPNMTMKLKCDHLPCQVSWTIMQPSLKKIEKSQNIQQMYDISESAHHMIAMVSCNNPEVKNFDQLVSTYSENQYIRGYTNNIIYLLFKKQKAGHLFFRIEPQAKSCAQMIVHNVKQEMLAEQQLKDFVLSNETNIYSLNQRPKGQFRIDGAFHEISKSVIKSQLILSLTGEVNNNRKIINTVSISPPIPTTDYEFSWMIPQISNEYSNVQVQARSTNNILIFNYLLSTDDKLEIEAGQHSHFNVTKGTVLKLSLIKEPEADSSERVFFYFSNPKQIKSSVQQCSKKQGCEFQVQALVNTNQVIYAGRNNTDVIKGKAVFFDFKDKITKKIRDEEQVYLKTALKKNQVVRVVVNNPNVIIRASSDQKCPLPTDECYEHIANSHHHFIYEPQKDTNLQFLVTGLDNCQFTLSIIKEGSQSIELTDGEPFSYLMDDVEKKIYFKFSLPEKIGVSFNLIAPLNDLLLIVNNGKQKPDGDQHIASTDGYISFAKTELESKEFRILVEKTPNAKRRPVHFTLIATSTGSNVRLDPGIAHAQSFKPKQFKDYVFEFDKKGDYIINFYIPPNVHKDEISFKLLASNEDKWTDDKVQNLDITENSDVLNLKDISQQLCIASGDVQCQIFIRLVNLMKIQVDITITLLVKDSVIQLKDGLWQTYAINTIAKTSHFYFLPKTKNSSINIMYKSSLVNVGISYTLWKSDKENIDPSDWPFPPYREDIQEKFSFFKSVNHIVIDTQNLQGCWPSCVILLSLFKKKGIGSLSFFDELNPDIQGNFSVMIANKNLQIPEKTKIQMILKQNEEKYLMVDLKYFMHKQALTFFTNEILGSFSLFGNVYSQKNPRCPTTSEYDFTFGKIQTQIKVSSIEDIIKDKNMDEDQDNFLCILATAYLESKFNIEFTSDEQIIKLLTYDTFERFELQPNVVKFFQLEAQQEYQLKFTREKGFFYVKISVCSNGGGDKNQYQDCLSQLQSSKDRGKQVITKTEEFSQKPCPKCIVFIKISSDDYCEAIIHVQSQYSMVDLKEKDIISDFTNEGEVNKYSITSVQKQETVINIQALEGEPIVTVKDFGDLEIIKEKDPKTNNIHIIIPPKKSQPTNVTPLGGIFYDAFTYSNSFRYFVVEIKSKNPKLSTSYTITYSSGERQTYLEDGMAIGYTLEANKKTVFLYNNQKDVVNGYISLTMEKSSILYNLKLKMFTFSDPNDEDSKVEVTPVKPPMRKHTPNPTVVYSLPSSKLVSLQLESDIEAKVTLMVNHQELIILPFEQEFPYELKKGDSISFLADVNNPGYLLVTIRKCDQSSPDFGYTFDYDSFQKKEFQYTTDLTNDPKFNYYIKASKIGTLYMQMNGTDDFGLFSIKVHYQDTKFKGEKIKPGKNGLLQYEILDSTKAQVQFHAAICPGGKCEKKIRYFWMAGTNLQDVYTQSVCPYSYFQILGIVSSQPLKINEINQKADSNGVITFNYNYQQHISYLEVKAIGGEDEIYYQPIEVITMWGSVTRASKGTTVLYGIAALFCSLCLLLIVRRQTKRTYEALTENDY